MGNQTTTDGSEDSSHDYVSMILWTYVPGVGDLVLDFWGLGCDGCAARVLIQCSRLEVFFSVQLLFIQTLVTRPLYSEGPHLWFYEPVFGKIYFSAVVLKMHWQLYCTFFFDSVENLQIICSCIWSSECM
jgi:hypothetical protein